MIDSNEDETSKTSADINLSSPSQVVFSYVATSYASSNTVPLNYSKESLPNMSFIMYASRFSLDSRL